MNNEFPVFTTPNECQDCYKCVRHCECKAIRIVNSRAAVIPELCVCCGECVKVCPAHAKKIRSDLMRAKFFLERGEKLYASIAPSYVGYFKNVSLAQLSGALLKLGFAGVSETALGAQLVSAETVRFLEQAEPGIYISSACPSAVEYILKYRNMYQHCITPIDSPVMAHAKLLHQTFGQEAKVIFIGPCAAKKLESDRHSEDLSLAITFPTLEKWLEEAEIDFATTGKGALVPYPAEEGRCYSLEGGMLDTVRTAPDNQLRYLAVSGIRELERVLENLDETELKRNHIRLFLEVLACRGGCVNGPAMPQDSAGIKVMLQTAATAQNRSSAGREVPVNIRCNFYGTQIAPREIAPEELNRALESVGKESIQDELNCGGCGYNTCREFARAMIDGKAEASMCLSYLRKISQKTSNALIRYIPAAVVIADDKLSIVECNRNFAKICGDDALTAFDTCGNLNGALLETLVPFADLFETVLSQDGELERFNQFYAEHIYNISVFSITPGKIAGAVIQDVTKSELKREQVAEKAREVIRKNVMTVQTIARYLGEHMADTEILLKEVAGTYATHPQQTPDATPDTPDKKA